MFQKRKSRSIITLPTFNSHVEISSYKQKLQTSSFDHFLGEDVKDSLSSPRMSDMNYNKHEEAVITQESNTPVHSYSTSGSDFEGILDLSTKLSGLSSSSSLSWSEDYELEITKRVQLELEKLDRAFQDLEDIPPPHNKDEIAEWKYFFPNICILGQRTPTNSAENSDVSSESEDENVTYTNFKNHSSSKPATVTFSRTRSSLQNKNRTVEQAQNFLNASRNYNTLPHKPKSLEIERYLKISSLNSPDTLKRKQSSQSLLTRQTSKEEVLGDISPEYTSLPFITATPLKTRTRKPAKKNSVPKFLTLPPITNNFRSISATPRQASSKSMFDSLNFQKDSSAGGSKISLKSDLLKLFDHIPITNR